MRSEESDRVTTFATTKSTLEAIITKIDAEIVEVKAHRFAMQSCRTTGEGIMTKSFAKFTRNDAILTATCVMCTGFDNEYQDAEASRRDELALIDALYALVKEK